MVLNSRSIANYIELELNKDRALSEIKQDLHNSGVPEKIINSAIQYAYLDEKKYLNKIRQKNNVAMDIPHKSAINQIWWIFVILIIVIITAALFFLFNHLQLI